MSNPEFAELKSNLKNLEIELFRRFEFEEKLKDSEKKYQNLIENMHDGLIVICENKVVFSNRAFVNLLGYTNKELYNLPLKNLFEPDFQKKVLDRIKKVLSGKSVLNPFMVKIIAKNHKSIKVNFNGKHIIYEGVNASQILVRDLTEKTSLEQEIAEQKEAAVFNRMESLAITGRLASGIAHEINNPLQGIKGQLYLLVKNLPK